MFVERLIIVARRHAEMPLTVDFRRFMRADPIGSEEVMRVAEALRVRQVRIRPVFSLNDPSGLITSAAMIAHSHENGACLRLGIEGVETDAENPEIAIDKALASMRLAPDRIDLLLDLNEVQSKQRSQEAFTLAVRALEWATKRPWRSVTLSSGAFPQSISTLPKDAPTTVPRVDADLWDVVKNTEVGNRVRPDFGDYAVVHPPTVGSVSHPPLPNLRYAVGREWVVYRQQRTSEGKDFFTLCERLVAAEHWSPLNSGSCWGDKEIARCASREGGPGNASKWLAYGVSRHLAVVTDRLASLSAP